MIYRHTAAQIQDYYDNPSINQSALKAILKVGVEQFIKEQAEAIHEDEQYYEDREHFLIGKAVDTLITEGKEVFDTSYFYSTLQKKPGEKPMAIVKKIFETTEPERRNKYLVNHKRELYDAMNTIVGTDGKIGYYLNNKIPSEKLIKGEVDTRTWEDDKRYLNLLADGSCQAYWDELTLANGKQVLTEEQNVLIWTMYRTFMEHPFTKHLYDEEVYKGDNMDIIYQMPLYWEEPVNVVINGNLRVLPQECKCLIDTTIVNHNKKRIVPFDGKTTRVPVTRFHTQVKIRRYDVQGAFYTRGINMCKGTIANIIGKNIADYDVASFAFVAQSTANPGTPLIYCMDSSLMGVGATGDGEDLLGFRDALLEYKTFEAHNFSITEMMEARRGIVWMDRNFDVFFN